MAWLRIPLAFVVAALVMAVAGTVAQTQFVLAALGGIGAPVSFSDRLAMTGADIVGFAPLYAALIAVGFLVAFGVAGLLLRWLALPRMLVFAAAGAACIALMLVLMREVFFGIPLIAGTRTVTGFAVQIACGALAGAVFAALLPERRPR